MGTKASAHKRIMAEDDEPEEGLPQKKSHDSSTNSIEKVTDYAEEKEMDTGAVADELKEIQAAEAADAKLQEERERELAAVKVAKEDVEVVAHEMALIPDVAERALRENKGDLKATLLALCRA